MNPTSPPPDAPRDGRALQALAQDPAALADARAAAERAGNDRDLLALRTLERALEGMPADIGGARRSRLLRADPVTTTWEAWQPTGERVFVRCLRPEWRDDVVVRRRVAADAAPVGTVPGVLAPTWHPDDDWPHLRVQVPGPLVADRLPVEDPPDPRWLARIAASALTAMAGLHGHGVAIGHSLETSLVEGPDGGVAVAWLGQFGPAPDPADDLLALGELFGALDPFGADPVAGLVRGWAADAPPTALDATALLVRTLAATLLAERHQLVLVARHAVRRSRSARLARLVRRLRASLPPPPGRFCLQADAGTATVLIESDGVRVRGGAAAGTARRFLPVVYAPGTGLDAQSARFLARAWARRSKGAPARRAELMAELGGSDEGAAQLVRWLQAMARLRSAGLLLHAAAQGKR